MFLKRTAMPRGRIHFVLTKAEIWWVCFAVTMHWVAVLLEQKLPLVFGNRSCMEEKKKIKAIKTFFYEIPPDKALSTQQCVGEEKCALNLLYLLRE